MQHRRQTTSNNCLGVTELEYITVVVSTRSFRYLLRTYQATEVSLTHNRRLITSSLSDLQIEDKIFQSSSPRYFTFSRVLLEMVCSYIERSWNAKRKGIIKWTG